MNELNRKIHFLGTKIRSLRKLNGLTLEDMVVRCMKIDNSNSPSVSYLSLIETGRRNPSKNILMLMSEIFQKDLEWFLDDTIQNEPLVKNEDARDVINSLLLEPIVSETITDNSLFSDIIIRTNL